MRMKDRIARLESRAEQSRPKKRSLPDWLQTSFEREGYIFDLAGQILGCPINRFGSRVDATGTNPQYLVTG